MDIPNFKALTIIYPNIVSSILTSAKVSTPKSLLLEGEIQIKRVQPVLRLIRFILRERKLTLRQILLIIREV